MREMERSFVNGNFWQNCALFVALKYIGVFENIKGGKEECRHQTEMKMQNF